MIHTHAGRALFRITVTPAWSCTSRPSWPAPTTACMTVSHSVGCRRRPGSGRMRICWPSTTTGAAGCRCERRERRGVAALHLYAIHEDVPFTRAMTNDVHDEVEALASWLELTVVRG